jgi:hypothetical protein
MWVWGAVVLLVVVLLWYMGAFSYTSGVSEHMRGVGGGHGLGHGLGMQVSGSPRLYSGRRDRPGWYDEYEYDPTIVYPYPYYVWPYPLLPDGDPNQN